MEQAEFKCTEGKKQRTHQGFSEQYAAFRYGHIQYKQLFNSVCMCVCVTWVKGGGGSLNIQLYADLLTLDNTCVTVIYYTALCFN